MTPLMCTQIGRERRKSAFTWKQVPDCNPECCARETREIRNIGSTTMSDGRPELRVNGLPKTLEKSTVRNLIDNHCSLRRRLIIMRPSQCAQICERKREREREREREKERERERERERFFEEMRVKSEGSLHTEEAIVSKQRLTYHAIWGGEHVP